MSIFRFVRHILLGVFLLLIEGHCFAAVHSQYEVMRLDNTNGLSSQKVYSIIEDNNGAIWIGTKSGVDRYNGRKLTNYKLDGDSYYGDMAGRIIRLLFSGGVIYAYDTTGKIYSYSPVLDKFVLQTRLSDFINGDMTLNKVVCCDNGEELYALKNGLYYRCGDGRIKPVILDVAVNDVLVVDGRIYIGTTSGLKLFDGDKQVLKDVPVLNDIDIQSLFYDRDRDRIYIGTFNRGLWEMQLPDGASVKAVHKECNYLFKPIRSITELDGNSIAIGVDGSGVLSYDRSNDTMKLLVNTEIDPKFSFTGNGIYALYCDRQHNLWIGSYTGGVTMVMFSSFPALTMVQKKDNSHSIANNNINSVAENIDGKIWYATDCGISIYSQEYGKWQHTLHDMVAVTLCPVSNGNMLVGCYGEGVFLLDAAGSIVEHWTQSNSGLPSNYVFAIKVDRDGDIWIGSPHGKLVSLTKEGVLKHRFEIENVLSLCLIDGNKIGAGTVNGFYIIEPGTQSYNWYASSQEQLEHDISTYIIPMQFNDDRTVWLGTEGGGLNLYDLKSRSIVRELKVSDGLPSNDVYGLQRDRSGRLWVSTGNGIAVVNDTIVSNLNFIKGIAKEYNKSSCTTLRNGEMIFGSTAGAVCLSPEKIGIADYCAPLRIIKLAVEGTEETDKDAFAGRLHEMVEDGHVELAYNHNSFEISFESINIQYRDDIAYRYVLDGYDKRWGNVSQENTARYRNVPPGKYMLRLQTVRKSDSKVLDQVRLELSIGKPWWDTVWAWIFYIFIVVLIGYYIFRYKWYQLRKHHDEDKIRFFINTAHDIRTPLSLVMAPLEELKKEDGLSENAQYLLNVAGVNIKKLNAVTSQLLDFEKIDSKKAKVRFEPINLNYLLSEEASCFKNICDSKGIELRQTIPDENIVVSVDRHLLELMLDNLLSNACKYTNSGGVVEIALTATKTRTVISIIDNGIGIPVKEQGNIFTNVYRAENARATQEAGNGFGLLQVRRIVELLHGDIKFVSKEGKGTTFTINFKRTYEEPIIQWNPSKLTDSIDEIGTPCKIVSQIDEEKGDTLLIVEDNDDLRNYLTSTFSKEYNVVSTVSADDALSFLESHYPDLILSDVMMPGTQGDEFCNIIKNNPALSGIPVILLTAKTTHDAIVSGLEKGADDYIAKPFSLDILKTKVRSMISNRRRIREYLLRQAVSKVELGQPDEAASSATDNPDAYVVEDVPALTESDKVFVDTATSIVIDNLGNLEFNIDMLCREMAMSRTLFFGRLKSLTGKGPQEFIRILRLERAAELLKSGVPVTEVSERTGFVNPKYFSTIFKKHFGVSPSKFTIKAE